MTVVNETFFFLFFRVHSALCLGSFQAGEKLRKDSSFRLPHGNGFARTLALRTLGCLMVTAFRKLEKTQDKKLEKKKFALNSRSFGKIRTKFAQFREKFALNSRSFGKNSH